MPVRPANATLRTREYLTPAEVEKLTKAARAGRYGHRDATLILIAYRHGLRAIEVCDLEWSQVEFGRTATLHVRRAKNGKPATHPIRGDELRALRKLQREASKSSLSLCQSGAVHSQPIRSTGSSSGRTESSRTARRIVRNARYRATLMSMRATSPDHSQVLSRSSVQDGTAKRLKCALRT